MIFINFLKQSPKKISLLCESSKNKNSTYDDIKIKKNRAEIELYSNCDSLTIRSNGYIPLYLSGLSSICADTIVIELNELESYIPGDTIYCTTTYHNKSKHETIIRKNSEKLKSIPERISVILNGREIIGILQIKDSFEIITGIHKSKDFQWVTIGKYAHYQFQIK
jgi:hypothetical protein